MARRVVIEYFYRLFTLGLFAAALSACGHTSSFTKTDFISAPIPSVEVDRAELMYQVLAGEFAGARGDADTAVSFYLQATKLSQDPSVAARGAYIALFARRYDAALQTIERWKLLGGNNMDITRSKALIFLRQEKASEAALQIEKLIIVDGKTELRDMAALSHILHNEASPDVAIKVLALLSQRYPGQAGLLLLRARIEANEKRFAKAKPLIEQVILMAPDISDAYLIKAQILAAENKEQEAVDAVALAVAKRPQDHRLKLQYARMLVQMRFYDEAWKNFIQLNEVIPDNENILLSLGLLAIETGKNKQAKQYLQALIDLGVHNLQAHYYLGRIQQSQGEYMPAIANYGRVNQGVYMLDAKIRSAALLAETGQVDKALHKLVELSKAQKNGDKVKVYLAQGAVLTKAQRNEEALHIYNAALQGLPENTDLLYARALIAEKLERLDIVESDLRMVLLHEPNNAIALNALGYTLADRTQRLDEAKGYILKAIKLLPDDPAVLDSLGWVYYRLGQYSNAIKWLKKAFEKLADAEIAAHLGEVLWVDGQKERANEIWRRGLEVKADHPVLLETIKRYKE